MHWRIEPFILPLMVATLLLIAAMQAHSWRNGFGVLCRGGRFGLSPNSCGAGDPRTMARRGSKSCGQTQPRSPLNWC